MRKVRRYYVSLSNYLFCKEAGVRLCDCITIAYQYHASLVSREALREHLTKYYVSDKFAITTTVPETIIRFIDEKSIHAYGIKSVVVDYLLSKLRESIEQGNTDVICAFETAKRLRGDVE